MSETMHVNDLTLSGSAFRRPVRVSITVPQHIHEALLSRSDREGRSLSNLAAFLLESTLASPLAD